MMGHIDSALHDGTYYRETKRVHCMMGHIDSALHDGTYCRQCTA